MEIFAMRVFILLVIIWLRALYENTHYEIEYKDIIDKRVNEEFKIIFFADLHNTVYGKNNEKLLNDINEFSPDIVLIAGDMFVAKKKERNIHARYILQEICKEHKVIYTFGNHETKLRNPEKYNHTISCLNELKYKNNLTILNNDQEMFYIKDNTVNVMGYEAGMKFYKKANGIRPSVEDVIASVGEKKSDENMISFLLAHNPDFFDAYAAYGADYVFSGHNHGGIVRLPFVGGVISTSFRPLPKYYGGEYKKNKTTMFVTRGLGSHTIRFRLFNMPQIHMYTFKKK